MKRRSDSVEKRECMTIKRLKSIVKHLAMRACRRNLRLKESSRGYIFLLMCVAIPVLLYGVKHSVDIVNENRVKIYEGDMQGTIHKRCGKEAALEVARRWNPGLTFKQQKESILRVADDVYNRNPTYYNSVAHNAIPGLEIRKHKTTVGGASDPLNVTMENTGDVGQVLDSSSRTVKYTTQNGQNVREIFNYGGNQMFHRIMYGDDKDPNFLLKQDESGKWVSEDMFWDVWWIPGYYDRNSCTLSFRSVYKAKGFYANCDGKNSANENTTYTQRAHSNDDKVQLTIENDKIKVQTDSDIGYAVPAECNVDIILAIPVNGAASNKNNCDKSSPTSENPTVFCVGSLSASSMDLTTIAYFEEYEQEIQTPVWQIAKAFKTFLRDNFEFTRGVNVGLIPYSGKLSIPPHRKAWTEPIANFDPSKFLQNQNSYPAYIRGCFLYNTLGKENSSLSAQAYTYDERNPKQYDLLSGSAMIWGICSALVGNSTPLTGVMCRGKLSVEETYGDNKMCLGDLLSTADPATSTKFRRANNIPCYLGYANFLSMTCEKTNVVAHKMFRDGGAINGTYSSHYYSLPYFLIELQPDVGKICDLLTAIGPVFDDYNVSNFLFIPITWANNLLQSWTEDPACDAIDTIGSSPTEGQLSRPSKTTTGRKKALILVVNKPDWFEPGELTHLGFDNDFSEIPMIESDCIRFDIDYSDTSRKFANGSSYDGIIMG
ncbi:MAG: hypothetical protein LBF57_00220, partial [Holosporaceae bacterium]|nr:hypothetical protein [Holosporaceae bacterium]